MPESKLYFFLENKDSNKYSLKIPARKSIEEVLTLKNFTDEYGKKIINGVDFERMVACLIGCVFPRMRLNVLPNTHRHEI